MRGDVVAVNDVSLRISPASWVAIMGPSGSGKSTLLLCLAGLLRASSGKVVLGNVDITAASESVLTKMRRGSIGFIFQQYNLIPALNVGHNVDLPSRFGRHLHSQQQIEKALADVGLDSLTDSRPDNLSGGQQQRVAIARALISKPTVLFADEPTGALDVKSGATVLDNFRQLVSSGTSVVMVTHDPNVAARADRVLFLVDGQITSDMNNPDAATISKLLVGLESA